MLEALKRTASTPSASQAPLVFIVLNNPSYFLSHRLGLARSIMARGCRVGVVAPFERESAEAIRRLGIDFHPWRLDRGSTNPAREALALWDLLRLYGVHRPQLVHHITPKAVLYGSLAARWSGVPARVNALTGLGYLFADGKPNAIQRMFASVQRRCHAGRRSRTIFQNPDDERLFITRGFIAMKNARLIRGSGVDPDQYRPQSAAPRQRPIILLPSRMLVDKGVEDTVAAVGLLKTRGVDCQLWLAGASDPANPRAVPEDKLRSWNAQGLALWLGHVDDMVALFHQASIVCLPSYYREGVPKALIEAASCALPIVTADTPGCREIVEHGRTGLLVEPRRPDRIADALAQLIADPARAAAMGRAGRELVEREFSLAQVNERTLAVYGEVHRHFSN